MSFLEWIREQSDRDDPIGDLSKDIKRDPTNNLDDDKDAWMGHLALSGACPEAIEALEQAWNEYQGH